MFFKGGSANHRKARFSFEFRVSVSGSEPKLRNAKLETRNYFRRCYLDCFHSSVLRSSNSSIHTRVPTFANIILKALGQDSRSSLAIARQARALVQGLNGDVLLRGFGVPDMKSLELFSLFVQPSPTRIKAVVLLVALAGVGPLKQVDVLPYPSRSTMFGWLGQEPTSVMAFLTRASLPADTAIAIVPVKSGAGNVSPLLPPEAS